MNICVVICGSIFEKCITISCIDAYIVALIGDTSNHHKLLYLSQLLMVSLHDHLERAQF